MANMDSRIRWPSGLVVDDGLLLIHVCKLCEIILFSQLSFELKGRVMSDK